MFIVPTPKTAAEAALQARVLQRAIILFHEGYTYEVETLLQSGAYYRVTSPEGTQYTVDPLIGTCTCPFFEKNLYCKHALAIEQELHTVAEMERRAEDEANAEYPLFLYR
jgi:hypothetical protein